ncbi:ATP-dependent DNA helicase SCO5184 [[Actinomadura] parvosata subsp. kistnae]|nr:ATP-dependent DNA helicase SCO5184 [Actinomadura parvosata subsp. kistnae]
MPVDLRLARRVGGQPAPLPSRLPHGRRRPGPGPPAQRQLPQRRPGARRRRPRPAAAAHGGPRGARAGPRPEPGRSRPRHLRLPRDRRRRGEVDRRRHRQAARPGDGPDGLPWGEKERKKTLALQPQDVAILARKRSQFPAIRRALEERDIPVEVVGLGGLLTVPEVSDIVAPARPVRRHGGRRAGQAAGRARWRIGPADLRVLGEHAPYPRQGAEREPPRGRPARPGGGRPGRGARQPGRRPRRAARQGGVAGVVLAAGPHEAGGARARAAPPARAHRAAAARPDQRGRAQARPRHRGGARSGTVGGAGAADLDAFLDAASRFAGDAEDPTLGAFLAYLQAAESEEFGLEAGRVGESNSVKLMTVHASKGLEWPVVVVPGLSQLVSSKGTIATGSIFPATPVMNSRWTENPRKLPYALRGDAADLPRLGGLSKEELAAFDEHCRERDLMEERRLAYVAVTRAHYHLIASGYRWGSATKPLEPSDFLLRSATPPTVSPCGPTISKRAPPTRCWPSRRGHLAGRARGAALRVRARRRPARRGRAGGHAGRTRTSRSRRTRRSGCGPGSATPTCCCASGSCTGAGPPPRSSCRRS